MPTANLRPRTTVPLGLPAGPNEIAPANASERGGLFNVVVSRDERSYAYNYSRSTSKLYVVEGMK